MFSILRLYLPYFILLLKILSAVLLCTVAEYNGSPPGMHGHSEAPLKNVKFLPYEKEDIAVFEWVGNQIGVQIHDYDV